MLCHSSSRPISKNTINTKAIAGFTLVETLVTLAIVGVLAALVLPEIIESSQNQELFAAFKKNYAVLCAAALKAKDNNGGTINKFYSSSAFCGWAFAGNSNDYYNTAACVERTLAKYLEVYSTWDFNYPVSNPLPFPEQPSSFINVTGSGGVHTGNPPYWALAAIKLKNGAVVGFPGTATDNCTDTLPGVATPNMCMAMWMDVNGSKGPNRVGRDVYLIYLSKDGMSVPIETNSSLDNCLSSSTDFWAKQGYGCAQKLLKTGKTY